MRKYLLLFAVCCISQAAICQPQTQFGKGADEYQQLFIALKKLLNESQYVKTVKLGGKDHKVFVPWIRDNVHVMKAMKHFDKDISS